MIEKKYKRKIVDDILNYLDSRDIIVVYGSRQVGKTTLLKYLIENYIKENCFYFDLEMQDLLDLCNEGPESVHQHLIQQGADEKQKVYLVIDEIQYIEDPSKFLKIFHDHYPNVKLLVSGSSTFEIKRKFKNSLAGRTVNFELYPLSFDEFLDFKGKSYNLQEENTSAINNELIRLAEEYLKYGGYPKIVLEGSEQKKQVYLFQIINAYVRKDIRDIGNIKNLFAFNKLISILASQSGQILNVSELSSTIGIRNETVLEYLDLLENTFIIKRVTPFHKNLRSELSKNPKVFFIDTGMMHLLWLKEFPKTILGNVFETFVFLELMKTNKQINFWRTTNRQEIDFIMSGKEIYAIEAKYNFEKSNKKNLEFFSKEYDCKTFVVGLKGRKSGKYIWEMLKIIEKDLKKQ
jgi:predicted AAA+ superfamily ATPase